MESVPKCPNCNGGGAVSIVSLDASGIFQPLPDGWDVAIEFYQCKCGWAVPVKAPASGRHLSKRSISLKQRLSTEAASKDSQPTTNRTPAG